MGLNRLKTKDLFLSAYLMSSDVYLLDIEREKGGRVVFTFLDTSRLDRLSEEYREGRANCNVVKLRESLQYLKDQMFTLLRKEERRYDDHQRKDRNRQAV